MYSDNIRTLFNDNWLFSSPRTVASFSQIPDSAEPIELPHAWNDVGWNYEKWKPESSSGVGWYFKYLPKHDPAQKLLLKFDGVAAECELFLNGFSIAHNLGAYKPFEVALTDCRGDGTDLLAVKVIDKQSLVPLSLDKSDPFIISSRYKSWAVPFGSSEYAGGIWRDVWLLTVPKVRMEPPAVKINIATGTVKVEIKVDNSDNKVYCEITDSQHRQVAKSAEEDNNLNYKLSMSVENCHHWHPSSPYLYSISTILLDKQGVECQRITQPLAFFDFRVRDSEFYLNGKPYFLRGQNGFPHCNIAHDREYINKYVSKIKEHGVEISRFHTEPPSHAWLDECDRQGIMVIFEMPLHGSIGCYAFGNKIFADTVLSEMEALVKEYRYHPSIVMWSLGNELIISTERDLGLGKPLFDILEHWCDELHRLDSRPIIANSGGDAVDLVKKTVGDVDDIHQYGGWYTENLRELNNFAQCSQKNDMVFQPLIVTESVAAYTDNNGEFMIRDETDVRQRKVVNLRLGKIKNLCKESLAMQAFILKEYAEAMWRLRKPDSNLSGYVPFGQYTWFFNPFDKGPEGLKEKPVWDVYRQVMSPVHVQIECWNRHLQSGKPLNGHLLLCHEDINLSAISQFIIEFKLSGKTINRQTAIVAYHKQFRANVELKLPILKQGDHQLQITVNCNNQIIAKNYLDFKVYDIESDDLANGENIYIYDPLEKLKITGVRLNNPGDICQYPPTNARFIIGPYALDEYVTDATTEIRQWVVAGGQVIVLEQNPGKHSRNILGAGINLVRKTQPYWSRWATNMVKHADRVDICDESHVMFAGISEADMSWWNGDTYLANNYLCVGETLNDSDEFTVLSHIGNGLLPDELMPVEYEFLDSGYSLTAVECKLGAGAILISSLLIGSKADCEPVAEKILQNLIKNGKENF